MLKDKHAALGATFAQFQGVETVAEYASGTAAEYQAAKEAAVLMDRSFVGRIELMGADRFEFLQRMSTNDMRHLKAGDGLQTVLTTPEAKIVDLLTIYVQPEALLCLTSPQNRMKVFNWFRRNIFFRDKVKPLDVSDSMAQLTLFGPRSADVLRAITPNDLTPLPAFHSTVLSIAGADVLAARVPHIAGGGYDLICQFERADALWDMLLEAGSPLGLKPMGTTAFNWLRLAASQPLYGYELSEEYNPLEARLNHAISFSKGCYTGQEVIARLDTYRKLKQQLVGVRLREWPRAPLPLPLRIGGQDVGTLTSVAQLPGHGNALGLGYVRAKFNQPGARIVVHSDGGPITGTLVGLPFAQAEVAT